VRGKSHAPKNVSSCRDANFFIPPCKKTEKHTKREHTFFPKRKKGILILYSFCRVYSICVASLFYHTIFYLSSEKSTSSCMMCFCIKSETCSARLPAIEKHQRRDPRAVRSRRGVSRTVTQIPMWHPARFGNGRLKLYRSLRVCQRFSCIRAKFLTHCSANAQNVHGTYTIVIAGVLL